MNNIIETDIGCHMYIECSCYSFDHTVKIGFLTGEIEEFYLEFRHNKYPIKDYKYYTGKLFKLYQLKNYIINIWYAIKGKPNRYTLDAMWELEQAKQIKGFIEYCIDTYNLNKGDKNEI